jgi:hypothetical protein
MITVLCSLLLTARATVRCSLLHCLCFCSQLFATARRLLLAAVQLSAAHCYTVSVSARSCSLLLAACCSQLCSCSLLLAACCSLLHCLPRCSQLLAAQQLSVALFCSQLSTARCSCSCSACAAAQLLLLGCSQELIFRQPFCSTFLLCIKCLSLVEVNQAILAWSF